MRDVLEIQSLRAIGNMEALLNLRLVTPEFEVLVALQRNGSLSSGDLKERVRLSNSGFNILLSRLIDMGVIDVTRCHNDQRRRKYRLSDKAQQAITNSAILVREPSWLE